MKSLYKVIMLTTMHFNTYKQGIARSEHHRRTSNPHHGMGVSWEGLSGNERGSSKLPQTLEDRISRECDSCLWLWFWQSDWPDLRTDMSSKVWSSDEFGIVDAACPLCNHQLESIPRNKLMKAFVCSKHFRCTNCSERFLYMIGQLFQLWRLILDPRPCLCWLLQQMLSYWVYSHTWYFDLHSEDFLWTGIWSWPNHGMKTVRLKI